MLFFSDVLDIVKASREYQASAFRGSTAEHGRFALPVIHQVFCRGIQPWDSGSLGTGFWINTPSNQFQIIQALYTRRNKLPFDGDGQRWQEDFYFDRTAGGESR
jgi:hypothetical protein